jgi:hypothetical protein
MILLLLVCLFSLGILVRNGGMRILNAGLGAMNGR